MINPFCSTTHPSAARLISGMAPFVLLFVASANLYAQQPMPISLKGSAEVPPVISSAEGEGQITVLPDNRVFGSIKTSGFVPTMAHIHEAVIGENGPPIMALTQTAADSFVVPAGARLTDAQYTSYTIGRLYINVHSAKYPDGEIRAQLLRTEAAATPTRAAN